MVISGTHRLGRRMRRGHPEQDAGHPAEQRPYRPDGHPGPDGAREVEQQPLHHQLPARLPRALLNNC
jgi:hypothetical protein